MFVLALPSTSLKSSASIAAGAYNLYRIAPLTSFASNTSFADADAAYEKVDASYGGEYFGRVDKGACLGLKAIVRWMAATPLWNGGTLPNDTRAFKDEYTTYDPKSWEAARDAAKDVLEAKDVN